MAVVLVAGAAADEQAGTMVAGGENVTTEGAGQDVRTTVWTKEAVVVAAAANADDDDDDDADGYVTVAPSGHTVVTASTVTVTTISFWSVAGQLGTVAAQLVMV